MLLLWSEVGILKGKEKHCQNMETSEIGSLLPLLLQIINETTQPIPPKRKRIHELSSSMGDVLAVTTDASFH